MQKNYGTRHKIIRVYSVVYDSPIGEQSSDNPQEIARFTKLDNASAFCAKHTCYGGKCVPSVEDVPAHIVNRWEFHD